MDDLPTGLFALGIGATVIALAAWIGDRRRWHRSDPDAVGFMPWTTVFFWALLVACLALGLAGREWLVGG
jgi:hypothetical protein